MFDSSLFSVSPTWVINEYAAVVITYGLNKKVESPRRRKANVQYRAETHDLHPAPLLPHLSLRLPHQPFRLPAARWQLMAAWQGPQEGAGRPG